MACSPCVAAERAKNAAAKRRVEAAREAEVEAADDVDKELDDLSNDFNLDERRWFGFGDVENLGGFAPKEGHFPRIKSTCGTTTCTSSTTCMEIDRTLSSKLLYQGKVYGLSFWSGRNGDMMNTEGRRS